MTNALRWPSLTWMLVWTFQCVVTQICGGSEKIAEEEIVREAATVGKNGMRV